jgi:hypothetical protein
MPSPPRARTPPPKADLELRETIANMVRGRDHDLAREEVQKSISKLELGKPNEAGRGSGSEQGSARAGGSGRQM